MILVNAANGQQGRLLVPKLVKAGMAVRACVQSERSAAEMRDAGVADVLVGEISQPDLIARAVAGAEKVYHVCPGIHPQEREIGFAWIDAARAAGVRHFVFSSVLHPLITALVQHEIKRDIEEHLIDSGLDFTILQPSIYMAPRRFGPAIAAGTLGTILSNVALGAGVVGVSGALMASGVSEDEATHYEREVKDGKVVVTVNAGNRSSEAEMILNQCGRLRNDRFNSPQLESTRM